MLELFDAGRLAHRFGHWRGLAYMVAAFLPLAVTVFLATVFTVLPGDSQPPDALQWIQVGLSGAAVLLVLYGCYRLYRDHAYQDYIEDAERYRRHGW
jgi:hypothetical protein